MEILLLALLAIILIQGVTLSKKIDAVSAKVDRLLKEKDVSMPDTILDLLHEYPIPYTTRKNFVRYIEISDEDQARKVLSDDTELSTARIREIITAAQIIHNQNNKQ